MIILDQDADALQNYGVAYCANAAPTPGLDARLARYRNAACIVPDRDSDIANNAFPAMLNPPAQSGGVLTGRMASGGPGLGYGQEWGTLGEEAAAEPAITRNLRLGQIVISRSPEVAVWNRRAFTSINVQFGVEGLQFFDRRLNQPLRIEDGWLVITGIASGGNVEIQRMTDTQWRSFQQERCASA